MHTCINANMHVCSHACMHACITDTAAASSISIRHAMVMIFTLAGSIVIVCSSEAVFGSYMGPWTCLWKRYSEVRKQRDLGEQPSLYV